MSADDRVSKAAAPASSSLFTVDFLLAVALIAAHSTYTYVVYQSHTKPAEMQQLAWWLPVTATIAYGAMIYFGKKLMSNRRPENPRSAMLLYNIYQSLINGFMALWLVVGAYRAGFTLWGNFEDRTTAGYDIAFGLWMHYNNKYLELFDTFFMVIKKKDEQISFLHVYHHILLVWSWFVVIIFCVGGDAYFGSAFNSLVHFMMYGYYAMALFAIPCPWKKHLTMFQMVQFVCCATQSLYCFYAGNLSWFIPALQLFVMLNMLVLFSRFYAKKYTKKPSVSSAGKKSPLTTETRAGFEFDGMRSSAASPPPTFSTALIGEASSPSPSPSPSPVPAAAAVEQEEDEDEQPSTTAAKKPSAKKRSKKAE